MKMKEDKTNYNLPDKWIWTTVGEIGVVISGGTPSTQNPEFWGGDIDWITPADLSNYNNKYISKGARCITKTGLFYSSAKLLPKGSILFSSRAPIGYVAIANNDLTTNQGFKNLIPAKSLFSDYVYYYFKTIKPLAEKMASGTTFLELSATKFSQIPFPLPPLNEQHRIVSKIEELFSDLDHAEKGLKKAQRQLEVYRQALLKSAFRGELITKKVKNNKLPEGWVWIKFNDFCKLQRGYDLPLSKITHGQYPVVTSSGIKGYHKKYKAKGPCLTTGRSGSVGKIHFMDVEYYWPHNTVLYVKDFCNNVPKFVYYYFLQFDFKSYSSSTAVPTLDRKQLYNANVPLPTLVEQEQIVLELDSRFSLIENLDNTIKINLQKTKAFRYAILKKAFSGKLVPQNPNDEDASKLLQKIQIEKENYLITKQNLYRNKPKRGLIMEINKSPREILEEAKEPIEARTLWKQSKYKDDIDDFYANLKNIENEIIVITKGKKTLIGLKNENR